MYMQRYAEVTGQPWAVSVARARPWLQDTESVTEDPGGRTHRFQVIWTQMGMSLADAAESLRPKAGQPLVLPEQALRATQKLHASWAAQFQKRLRVVYGIPERVASEMADKRNEYARAVSELRLLTTISHGEEQMRRAREHGANLTASDASLSVLLNAYVHDRTELRRFLDKATDQLIILLDATLMQSQASIEEQRVAFLRAMDGVGAYLDSHTMTASMQSFWEVRSVLDNTALLSEELVRAEVARTGKPVLVYTQRFRDLVMTALGPHATAELLANALGTGEQERAKMRSDLLVLLRGIQQGRDESEFLHGILFLCRRALFYDVAPNDPRSASSSFVRTLNAQRDNQTVVDILFSITWYCVGAFASDLANVRAQTAAISGPGAAQLLEQPDTHPIVRLVRSRAWELLGASGSSRDSAALASIYLRWAELAGSLDMDMPLLYGLCLGVMRQVLALLILDAPR